jgi:TonB-dependent starch-binding outer membrane protein SusC
MENTFQVIFMSEKRSKKIYKSGKAKPLYFLFVFIFMGIGLFAQQKIIVNGNITDNENIPLPGVNILIKGTAIGTVTDLMGNFSIFVPVDSVSLEISYLGYNTEVIYVGGQRYIHVALIPDLTSLEEVVVIGYGTTRKRDITGSVAKVDNKEFNQGYVTNAEQLIANKIPGVQVIPTSGKPGAGSSFLIRGGASLNASNNPLIVIDGVPLEGASEEPGFLSSLNPADIESFTVLKDASAAAIYGSRGSNGVIIITTKSGGDKKLSFNFNSRFSASTLAKKQDVLNGDQFRKIVQTAAEYSGLSIEDFNLGTANTDWQDEIYQVGLGTDNNFSFSGGITNLPYRLSVSYLNQDGILKTSNYERVTTSLNVSPVLLDNHLKIQVNVKGSFENEKIADERAINSAISFDPTQPVYTGEDKYNGFFEYDKYASNPANLHGHYNPLGMLEQIDSRQKTNGSIGNIQLDYKFHFLPDLRLNVNSGYEIARSSSSYYAGENVFEQQVSLGSVYNAKPLLEKTNLFFESYLNYVKDFKSVQGRLDIMAGYSYNDFLTKNYYYPTYNVFDDVHTDSEPVYPFDKPQNTLISYYARLNYFIRDKYLITSTVRQDGSSRFSESNRWGIFPSVALAWKINQENFLTDVELISNLKLRIGYGVTGQQDGIGNYDYIPMYSYGDNSLLYQVGNSYYRRILPSATDRNRKWEQTATSNIGLDWGVLDNRISGSIDLYYKKTSDLLNTVNVPVGTDFTNSITKNIGSMENRGIEVSVNGQPVKNNDFSWDIAASFSFNKNKIISLSENNDDVVGLFSGEYLVNTVGYSRNTFYLYHQVYDVDGTPLEETMLDVNNDGVINEKDRYRSESSVPEFILGFSTNFRYKKLTLNAAFHSNLGHYMFYRPLDNLGAVYGWAVPFNLSTLYDETQFKMLGDQAQYYSDYYLQNASFLKMDNITLSYQVGKIFKSIHQDAVLGINASVQNVFLLTKYTGADPEASWNWGLDWGDNYPAPRIFALGLNLNF